MAAVGVVSIGGRRITLDALTGEVVDPPRSAHVQKSAECERDTWTWIWHYNTFHVRTPGGKDWPVEIEERVAAVSKGQRVTLVRGIVGKKESNWLAVFNHTTDRLGYVAQTRNDLAGPLFYNLLMIVAVFVGVFALFSLAGAFGESSIIALFGLIASGAYFVWVFHRRRKLSEAVEDAVKRLGTQPRDAAAS
jgi:hypothetical protein